MWLKKKLNLPRTSRLQLLLINTRIFCVFHAQVNFIPFFEIPSGLYLKLSEQQLWANKKTKNIRWRRFFRLVTATTTTLRTHASCQIRVRGAGLGVLLPHSSILEFRLGQNVRLLLPIPLKVTVVNLKKNLLIESAHRALLGNFCATILRLTRQNFFTGRGFWIKNQLITLRPIKK